MKKIFKKIKKSLKNSGSTLILVIVALGFVGILTGSLLTAVAYAYRQKLYDYNAKSNFYYLEQAMDEVYAGVGSKTMEYMNEAYEETREKAVKYNLKTHQYENIGNENANEMFKTEFMKKFASSLDDNTFIPIMSSGKVSVSDGVGKTITDCISNYKNPSDANSKGTIELVTDDLRVIVYYTDGTSVSLYKNDTSSTLVNPLSTGKTIAKVVIKNVTLKRSANYSRSTAKGNFTQTISTDIEINRPDFDVSFDGSNTNVNNLFSFCLLADSGVEVNKMPGSVLSINGNIYAASDFYNKKYNDYDGKNDADYKTALPWKRADGSEKSYSMNKVTNYSYVDNDNTTLYNKNDIANAVPLNDAKYDGNNVKSKYSGFYINGNTVNIFASKIIVPGSIAVMDAGSLSVYGTNGTQITQSEVWADEVVLDGSVKGTPTFDTNSVVTGLSDTNKKYGAKADFTANMYIKDDTQIESDYSRFRLNGSYYGFGDSTDKDSRKFIPTTLISSGANGGNIYEEYGNLGAGKGDGNKIRAHYNSSAFIVNGEHANVNLIDTKSIYIAGRSYIELSKLKNAKESTSYKALVGENGNILTETGGNAYAKVTSTSFKYDSDIQDYKTGESLSIKSNQLAYKPSAAPVNEKYVLNSNGKFDHTVENSYTGTSYEQYFSYLTDDLKGMVLFSKYFSTANVSSDGKGGKVPVIYTEENYTNAAGKKVTKYYYYLDFQFAFDNDLYDTSKFTKDENDLTKIYIKSGDELSENFIIDYYNYLAYVDEYHTFGSVAFLASHTGIDTDVLDNENDITIGGTDFKRTDSLANLMDYEDYSAGAIGTKDNIYSSGAVTTSYNKTATDQLGTQAGKAAIKNALTSEDDVTFFVQTNTESEISSTVLGATEDTISSTKIEGASDATKMSKALALSDEYEEHYNYMKWSLQDLPTANSSIADSMSESQFVRKVVTEKGATSLTPLNSYFNFDKIVEHDADQGNNATSINPENLKLSYNASEGYSEYKVYVDYNDVHIKCESAAENGKITGIIVTKGDVYFDEYNGSEAYKTVKEFNGIIISGGKVYVNSTVTNINSSELCKTIMNQCIVKSQDCLSTDSDKKTQAINAIKVLEVFKDYEDFGKLQRKIIADPTLADELNTDEFKNISTIDYSDVIRYNNWMRNVD